MSARASAVSTLARLLLGGVFVFYGWHKIAQPEAFLKALRAYDLVPASPPEIMNSVAVVLPWVELICGALLLVGAWRRCAAEWVMTLTAVFTAVVAWRAWWEAEASGLSLCLVEFDCGCGQGPVWLCRKLAENALLIGLALVVIRSEGRLRRPGQSLPTS